MICKHFQDCGGCKFQDTPYQEQLKAKQERVKELMSVYGIEAELRPINSFQEWYYRGKMEFSFGQGNVCGLYSKKTKRQVVDLEECLIFSADAKEILRTVKDFVNGRSYEVYNKFSHKGFVRNLILRQAKFSSETMVGIVVTGEQQFDKQGFVDGVLSLSLESKIKSIYLVINDSWSDAVVFEKKELLYGEPFIQEDLQGVKFNIGIDSFFQTNSRGIARLYEKVKDYAGLQGTERVLDLFCGVGSIGIFLAPSAKFVWGVEVKQEIVDAAWQNAKLNKIENISFFSADARKFLNTQGSFYRDIDVMIVNPPRCGLSPKMIRAMLRLNPKVIIYSSCNPDSLFSNIRDLKYKVEFVEPFDFFPHTPHLECLTFLARNN